MGFAEEAWEEATGESLDDDPFSTPSELEEAIFQANGMIHHGWLEL